MFTARRDRDWLLLFAGLIAGGVLLVAVGVAIAP